MNLKHTTGKEDRVIAEAIDALDNLAASPFSGDDLQDIIQSLDDKITEQQERIEELEKSE